MAICSCAPLRACCVDAASGRLRSARRLRLLIVVGLEACFASGQGRVALLLEPQCELASARRDDLALGEDVHEVGLM